MTDQSNNQTPEPKTTAEQFGAWIEDRFDQQRPDLRLTDYITDNRENQN